MAGMGLGQGDPCWEAIVGALLAVGHASERRSRFADKSAVQRDPARRDWIALHLASAADLDRLGGLLAIAAAANA